MKRSFLQVRTLVVHITFHTLTHERLGYLKDDEAFQKKVDEDALEFKPLGTKIHSYTRPVEGKDRAAVGETLDPQSEDVIEFEVYHVRFFLQILPRAFLLGADYVNRRRGLRQDGKNIIGGCRSLYCFISRLGLISSRTKILGSSSFCKSLSLASLFKRSDLFVDMKNERDEGIPRQ